MSMPLCCANVLTGLAAARMPRPAGRSGCVSTSAIWCPAATNRASERSANAGVPAKIRRRNAPPLRRPSGGLAQLLRELGADALLLELGKVLDEHLACQVIHFVLDAYGQQALRFERECVAVLVEGANLDALGTRHQLVDARQRKAALLDIGLAGGLDDFGIDQDDERIAAFGYVDHDDLLVYVDLGCGKADARGGIHGLGHVGGELL